MRVGLHPQAVAVADFNGDGSVDVAYAHLSFVHNTIAVQLNLGDGTMGPVVAYRRPTGPTTSSRRTSTVTNHRT